MKIKYFKIIDTGIFYTLSMYVYLKDLNENQFNTLTKSMYGDTNEIELLNYREDIKRNVTKIKITFKSIKLKGVEKIIVKEIFKDINKALLYNKHPIYQNFCKSALKNIHSI